MKYFGSVAISAIDARDATKDSAVFFCSSMYDDMMAMSTVDVGGTY